jgi:hypothetical protein
MMMIMMKVKNMYPTNRSLLMHYYGFFNFFIRIGVESNWVHSALRPPTGLLCQPRVIMMMENFVE